MTPNLADINRKLDFEKCLLFNIAYSTSLLLWRKGVGVCACVIHAELCLWAEIDHVCLSFNGGRQNPGSSPLRSEKDVSGTDMFNPPPKWHTTQTAAEMLKNNREPLCRVSVTYLVCELRDCGQRLYLSINWCSNRPACEILYGWHYGMPAQVLGNCEKTNIQHRERVQQLYILHKLYVNSETLV